MVNSKNIYFFLGSALSQVFALLTSVYILRYATPDLYGKFSYFVAFGSILGSVATLKFEQSIAISKNLDETQDKFALTIQTCFYLSLFFILAFVLFNQQISAFDLGLIFLLANAIALNASLQQLFLFLELHKYNGLLSLLYAALNFVLVILLLNYKGGLNTSYVLAYVLASICFVFVARKFGFKMRLFNITKFINLFKENIAYPKFILPGAISTILLTYGHPIFIKHIFSEAELGLFSLSLRILLLPTILVGAVVSGLFRASISKLYLNNQFEEIQKSTMKVMKFLFVTAIIGYPCLIFAISKISYFLKGNEWTGIEQVSVLLVLYAIAQYFYLPLSNIALVCERKKMLMYLNFGQLFFTLLVYLLSYVMHLSFNVFLGMLSAVILIYSAYACFKFISIGKGMAV